MTSAGYDAEIMQHHEVTGYAGAWRYTLLPDPRREESGSCTDSCRRPFLEGMENKDANASKSVDLLQLFVHRYLEEYIEQ
jgi:hypothetical protein